MPDYRIHAEPGNQQRKKVQLEPKIDQILNEYEDEMSADSVDFAAVQHIVNAKGHRVKQILWLVIVVTCFGLCIYQTYERTAYYLTEPSSLLIEIRELKKMVYPTFVFCLYYPGSMMTKLINKAKKLPSPKPHPCTFDLLHLLHYSYLKTTEKVWNNSFGGADWKIADFDVPFDVPLIKPPLLVETSTAMPQGRCVTYETPTSVNYSGTMNQIIFMTSNRRDKYCKEIEFFYFQNEMFVNPTIARRIPFELTSPFRLEQKRFFHRNTKSHPCVPMHESAACQQNCYQEKIFKETTCWLPFMTKYDRSVECNTTADGLKTKEIAMDIYQNLNPKSACGCVKPCEWIYFNGELETPQEAILDMTAFMAYYPENFIEHLMEVEAYPFIKLVCDVGGNLGLYLGLSLLSIADSLQALLDAVKKVLASKNH